MQFKRLTALAMATVAGMLLGGSALLAQEKSEGREKQPTFGQVESQERSYSAEIAEKKFGYATTRGAFLVQVKSPGKAMICIREGNKPEQFRDDLKLKYLRYASTDNGFAGPYYEAKVGTTTVRMLFSYNTDAYGNHYVFYANENDSIYATFQASSRCESK